MAAIIHVDPQDALVDDVVSIKVTGLSEKQPITIQASIDDEHGHTFGATACLIASEDGCVDLSQQPSVSGTYRGVSAMGLFLSLKSGQGQTSYYRQLQHDASLPLEFSLTVYTGHLSFADTFSSTPAGDAICRTTLRRWYKAKGVQRIKVRHGRLRGTLFLPPGQGPFPAVIDLFGTTGNIFESRAALLASRGVAALALPYFMYDDLPRKVKDVQLEYFMEAIEWLSAHRCVISDNLGVIGTSKGGEIALFMAYYSPKVKAVVSINGAPFFTSYPMQYRGKLVGLSSIDTVHTVVTDEGNAYGNVFLCDKDTYLPIWDRDDVKVLLVVEGDDHGLNPDILESLYQMYPDERKCNCQLVVYPGAGHLIDPPYASLVRVSTQILQQRPGDDGTLEIRFLWGGYPEQHATAQYDAWRRTLEHFRSNLANNESTAPACRL